MFCARIPSGAGCRGNVREALFVTLVLNRAQQPMRAGCQCGRSVLASPHAPMRELRPRERRRFRLLPVLCGAVRGRRACAGAAEDGDGVVLRRHGVSRCPAPENRRRSPLAKLVILARPACRRQTGEFAMVRRQ